MAENKNNLSFFSLNKLTAITLEADLVGLFGKFSASNELIVRFAKLTVDRYCEKHRHYHNLSHVQNLLTSAEKCMDNINNDEIVRLAIWFHDVIYQPRKQNNEAESAKFAAACLSQLDFPRTVIENVKQMIVATHKHDAAGLDFDGRLFLDLDLGILGAQPEIYQQYKRAIRREYSFVPWFLYRRSRATILGNFLKRDFIYFTNEMREKFEAAARENVADEIKELS